MNHTMGARDWTSVLVLSLLWGGAFFLTEIALEGFPPFTVVAGRVGFAALALIAVIKLRGGRLPVDLKLWGAFLVMGAINNVLPFSLIVSGQVHIDSGLAAILNATTPMFSVVLAHFLTRDERMTAGRALGLLLGLGGVAVLVGPSALAGLGAQGWAQLAVLGAAFAYALAAIYGRRFAGLPPLVVAAGQLTCSSLIMVPVALALDRPWTLEPGWAPWLAVLGLALPATALAYGIYFRILASAGATNLLLVTLLIPVSALLLGALILGEEIGASALAGMAMIFLGLAAIDGRAAGWLRQAGDRRRAARD
jgi:drug/metabolite transporter (DMT)-like permease